MVKKLIIFLILIFSVGVIPAQLVNLALGKPVTSSSVDDSANPNSNLTDGNFSTVARTGTAEVPPNAEWFMVDLGADYYINTIAVGSMVPDDTKSRRFMVITFPSNLGGLGFSPDTYISNVQASLYNRYIYSLNSTADQVFGKTAANPNIPGNPGQSLGPQFANGIYNVDIGIHRARYILVLNLQDTNLEFTELQVFPSNVAVRTFVNGSFEQGATTTTWTPVPEGNLPGWSTTDPVSGLQPNTINLENGKGGCVDIISQGYIGVAPYQGTYYAELNSFVGAMLSQDPICILKNETFNWSLAHRGRDGTDVMRLVIDDVEVAEFTDNNVQAGTHTFSILSGGTAANLTVTKEATTATGWTRYHGTWTNTTGLNKQVNFAFRAVSSVGGLAQGNFLDDIQISGLSSIMTFDKLNPKGNESNSAANLPKILINGPLAVPRTVQIKITGGTAVRGVDYTTTPATGNLSVTIPAGTYDGTDATAVSIASVLQVSQDFISEGDETIIMELLDPGTGDLQLADGGSCQGAVTTSTYTITDFVCYKNPVMGPALPTNMGITAFNRAGNGAAEWPGVRKGGYLALESATKGLVISRTTKASITNPVIGMMIYETNDKCFSVYTSAGWRCYQSLSCPD